jgi:hypothetical protein
MMEAEDDLFTIARKQLVARYFLCIVARYLMRGNHAAPTSD